MNRDVLNRIQRYTKKKKKISESLYSVQNIYSDEHWASF